MPDSSIDGRVALVTGGSRGIGRAVSLALADAGAVVAVNYRTRAEEAAEVVAAIAARAGTARAVAADVSDSGQVATMIHDVTTNLGSVDILVNNAGIGEIRNLDELTEADFDRTIAVNLKSAFLVTQAVLPGMRERRWGRIANISSVAARGAGIVGVHYNAAKAGLEGLTRGYAARVARAGVTVNAVAPGPVDTEMGDAVREGAANRIPLGRMGTTDEVAHTVLAVLTNPYLTGQTIGLNGGLLLG